MNCICLFVSVKSVNNSFWNVSIFECGNHALGRTTHYAPQDGASAAEGLQPLLGPLREEEAEAEGGLCELYPSNCNALYVLAERQHDGVSPLR